MKRRISALLAAVLVVGSLATACGGAGGNAGGEVKVGLGLHTDYSYSSKDFSEEGDGKAQTDLHIAAVKVDADGKIVDVVVDAMQLSVTFDGTGAITSDPVAKFQTKRELGDAYGMKGVSASIGAIEGGAEWYDQANAFEQYCIGKTADEVAAGVNAEGYPTDETLLTGCTMKVNGMAAAVVKACNDANAGKASANDTLSLGVVGELTDGKSKNAAENEGTGTAQAYANFVAVTADADGKITCAVLDSVQGNMAWTSEGKLDFNTTEDTTTKYDLKEAYGMKGVSASNGVIAEGGEWYEQADAFMAHVVGKTAADVAAIAMDESGYPTDETLRTGCTMKVKAYVEAVTKALAK